MPAAVLRANLVSSLCTWTSMQRRIIDKLHRDGELNHIVGLQVIARDCLWTTLSQSLLTFLSTMQALSLQIPSTPAPTLSQSSEPLQPADRTSSGASPNAPHSPVTRCIPDQCRRRICPRDSSTAPVRRQRFRLKHCEKAAREARARQRTPLSPREAHRRPGQQCRPMGV